MSLDRAKVWPLAALLLASFERSACAYVAHVAVARNNPAGTIAPGQQLAIRVVVSWEPNPSLQFAGLRGDLLVVGALGSASNVGSDFAFGSGPPLVVLGQPAGGSVVGTDIATIPGFFTASPSPPSIQWWGVNYLTFTWTAPSVSEPTLLGFEFVADPIAPNVRLYPSSASPAFVEASTTYTGMSIVVLPSPGAAGIGLVVGALATTRLRRG
jgi:hypothetical protein